MPIKQILKRKKYIRPTTTTARTKALTVREHAKALKLYKKFYGKGVTINNALKMSLLIDKERAKKQLSIVRLDAYRKGQMWFVVRASGLHLGNFYGKPTKEIADEHIVNIEFDVDKLLNEKVTVPKSKAPKTVEEFVAYKIKNTPLKYQCSCGRHTFWYRYTWTVLRSSLGLQEPQFPRIRNKNLNGLVCKHGLKVFSLLQSKQGVKVLGRYMKRLSDDKQFRVNKEDKKEMENWREK